MSRVVSWNVMKSRDRLNTIVEDLSAMDLLFIQENTRDLSSICEFNPAGTYLLLIQNLCKTNAYVLLLLQTSQIHFKSSRSFLWHSRTTVT